MKKNRPQSVVDSQSKTLNAKGTTIIELMMVVGLIGLVMALITSLSYTGITAWQKQSARIQLEAQAQSFMYVLSYNLRQADPSTVSISSLAGEMNESLITFSMAGKTNPVSIFLKTIAGSGTKLDRQILISEPLSAASTIYSTNPQVLAQNVVSLYFTFPKIADTSRVMVNLTLQNTPLKNKEPVFLQTQETIYVRN